MPAVVYLLTDDDALDGILYCNSSQQRPGLYVPIFARLLCERANRYRLDVVIGRRDEGPKKRNMSPNRFLNWSLVLAVFGTSRGFGHHGQK